ncbi:hypothetical protein CWB41_13915 [Methylovirgula ligni]|nr:DUF2312 domain-containing protein [Methylovirgula ligni]QAY97402.1 hypothetical protein CWB41_13915 [Methylovirgula ligni]
MSESHRRNGVAGEELRGYIERIESIRAEKKELSEDEKLVMAEARAAGFDTRTIGYVVKVRSKKPSEVEEAKALADLYLSALGMQKELPLFRTVDLMDVDVTAKEQVVEALKKFVPSAGAIVIEAGGKPLRLTRGEDGEVLVAEVEKPKRDGGGNTSKTKPAKPPADVPDCDPDAAEELGRDAARADVPIIRNPVPVRRSAAAALGSGMAQAIGQRRHGAW